MAKLNPFDLYDVASLLSEEELMIKESVARFVDERAMPLIARHFDEALFLGGRPKGEFLKAFGADIFFDDQQIHIDSAKDHVASAHVPNGIINELK